LGCSSFFLLARKLTGAGKPDASHTFDTTSLGEQIPASDFSGQNDVLSRKLSMLWVKLSKT
jgi:hypothetical protein